MKTQGVSLNLESYQLNLSLVDLFGSAVVVAGCASVGVAGNVLGYFD